ncbi:MAG: hypothetical protein C0480_11195 [Bradyrhizobium sp.]|jgi:hypothetical protein|nr:hypothetical protein [Bradyrhizobium sp.]
MVHRTDTTGLSMGRQVLVTAYAVPLSMAPFSKTTSHSADKKCCRLLTTAVPPLHAIDLELLTL